MNAVESVRALFVPGESVRCVENTYHRAAGKLDAIGRVWEVERVGKTVWNPVESGFRGTFPQRVSDVLTVDENSATWRIGRGDHTVTYERVR